jgi:hypothetical protein
MKTMTISLIVVLLLAGGLLAQRPPEIRTAGMDLLGALNGDVEKFERGMRTLESMLAKNPKDPEVKVLHGTGVFCTLRRGIPERGHAKCDETVAVGLG